MANPVLKVILQAVDNVTDVAKKAQESVSTFTDRAKSALTTLGTLAAGIGLGAFFRSAVEEASAAEVGMGRLGVAVRNAGGDFGQLKPELEKTVDSVLRLTKYTDDDLRSALTNMIAISGDVAGSQKNLALAADLAAFKHISLEEAATIVAKAMNGNVTALNKLGVAGKDANVVLEQARASFGGFAADEGSTFSGRLAQVNNQWGEFKEAVGKAIISNNDVRDAAGTLVQRLADLAGWVEANEVGISKYASVAVDALSQLAGTFSSLWDAIGPAIKLLGKGIPYGLEVMSLAFRETAAVVQGFVGEVAFFLGGLVLTGSNLLKAFGINVGQDLGKTLAQWGGEMAVGARKNIEIARETFWIGLGKLEADEKKSNQRREKETTRHTNETGGITGRGLADRQAAEEKAAELAAKAHEKWNRASLKELEDLGAALARTRQEQGKDAAESAELLAKELGVKLGKASADAIGLTTEAMGLLLEKLKTKIPLEDWETLNGKLQSHKTRLEDLLPPADALATAAQHAAEENERIAQSQDTQKRNGRGIIESTATLARAFVEAADATGIIDDKMANVLNSAISLASALPLAFAGDPASIAQAVTSLANIIVGIGASETEKRREANRQANTIAIERLTREVGNLNLRESGKTFAGIQNAVDSAVQARADARAAGKGPGAADQAAKDAFLKSLRSQGIGVEEARALFKEMFGRDLSMANAGTFFADIADFQQGLQRTEFGQFGSDFEGQLDAMLKGFDILGTQDADAKLAEFKSLAAKFSPALADALSGDLSTVEGRAKASQNLRELFGKLKTGGLKPEEIGVSGAQFLTLLQDLLPLLAAADGTGGSAASTASRASSAGIGALATPTLGALGAPGLPLLDVPTPTWAADAFNAARAPEVSIAGGVHTTNTFNIYQREGEDLEELARRVSGLVDETMALRYDSARAARGVLPSAA